VCTARRERRCAVRRWRGRTGRSASWRAKCPRPPTPVLRGARPQSSYGGCCRGPRCGDESVTSGRLRRTSAEPWLQSRAVAKRGAWRRNAPWSLPLDRPPCWPGPLAMLPRFVLSRLPWTSCVGGLRHWVTQSSHCLARRDCRRCSLALARWWLTRPHLALPPQATPQLPGGGSRM